MDCGIEPIPEEVDSNQTPQIEQSQDPHDKLLKWLIEMAGEENINFNDPAIVQQMKTSILGEKLLKETDKLVYQRSQSSDSHGSSSDYQFRGSRSYVDEDGPMRAQDTKTSPQPPYRTQRYTKLKKQSSVSHPFNKAGSESPIPTYQRSTKSYSDLNDSVNFFQHQEQNLMLSHRAPRRHRPRAARNKFVKQFSESHAETYNVGSGGMSESIGLSKVASIDCVDNSRLSVRPTCSRQTTFSDEDEIISEKSVSPSAHPPMDVLQLLEHNDSIDGQEVKPCRKNRRRSKNVFGDIISRSVGNLMDRSSRIKHNIRIKSASLFTINVKPSKQENDEKAYQIDKDSKIIEVAEKENEEIYLDDALLDGNMADILCAVDALWPGKEGKDLFPAGDALGLR